MTMSVLDIYGDVVSTSPKAIGLLTKLQAQVNDRTTEVSGAKFDHGGLTKFLV